MQKHFRKVVGGFGKKSAIKMENKYHKGLKTLREKEKLLVTSNFSFSHTVFYSYISLVCQNAVLCGNGLNCLFFL